MDPQSPEALSLAPCRIKVLPADLANQIAAGEVVARPASAIKELCENSLDAGATSLEVEIDGGGITRLMVLDDGSGMTREEAILAVERHATSKIKNLDDLFSISTMGFRGEALPSIASVSRFSLTTRRRDDIAGTTIELEGGGKPKVKDAGCPVGTRVEIKDLFFNTPARRKFLKAEATERGHAIEAVTRLALARPDVSFKVRADGREAFTAPKTTTLKARAAQVFGRKVAEELFPFREEAHNISIEGLLGHPGLARAGTKGISLFVNKRYVVDKTVSSALANAYGGLLDKGRYPLAIVMLEIDPRKIDVNVHPAKEEIRFSDAQVIFAAVRRAALEGLRHTPWLGSEFYAIEKKKSAVPDLGEGNTQNSETHFQPMSLPEVAPAERPNQTPVGPVDAPHTLDVPLSSTPKQELTPSWLSPWNGAPREQNPLSISQPLSDTPASTSTTSQGLTPTSDEEVSLNKAEGRRSESQGNNPAASTGVASLSSSAPRLAPSPSLSSLAPHHVPTRPAFFRAMRHVGQIKATYLVMEAPNGLMLLDQHAAHERVTYERLKVAFQHKQIPRQRLLFPATVELSPLEVSLCESFSQELLDLGLETATYGPHTIAVIEVPLLLAKGDPEKLLKGALDELSKKDTEVSLDEKRNHLLATMACHSSVRAGQQLTQDEVRSLLASMDETDNIGHCPHGRPVYLELGWKDLEKRFGRLGNFLP